MAVSNGTNGVSRGEMIRRLDDAAAEVHRLLSFETLNPEEHHALAVTLSRLLPLVADSLQDQEDREAAETLLQGLRRKLAKQVRAEIEQ